MSLTQEYESQIKALREARLDLVRVKNLRTTAERNLDAANTALSEADKVCLTASNNLIKAICGDIK